jgi:hypothetical protein
VAIPVPPQLTVGRTTSLDDPLIIATLTTADGEPTGPLLVDGYARPDTVR